MTAVFTNLVGYSAAAVGTFLMVPQVIRSFRTKKARDVSMAMVILYVLNCLLWLAYGLLIPAMPVIVANATALVVGVIQLILRFKHDC